MMDRADAPCRSHRLERTDIFAALMLHDTGRAIGVGKFQRHHQARRTERFTRRCELPLFGFVVTLFGVGDRREAEVGVGFAVKIGINVPGVERCIKGGIARACAQPRVGQLHQGKEVGDVAVVESLGQFGDDEFTPRGNFRHHNARPVAPIIFTRLNQFRGHGITPGRG